MEWGMYTPEVGPFRVLHDPIYTVYSAGIRSGRLREVVVRESRAIGLKATSRIGVREQRR